MFRKTLLVCLTLLLSCFFCANTALANLVLAEGKPTGQWYNPERDGEGFYVEIIDSGGVLQISLAMYTYDSEGNQMWLIGNALIDEDDEVVTVPVLYVDGPVWGPDYNPDDRNIVDFGTITATFTSCNSALFQVRTNVELVGGDYPAVRLTDIVGIECTDPAPETGGVTAGEWEGDGVCMNVAADGKSLTTENSTCPNGVSAWLDIVGVQANIGGGTNPEPCKVDATCLTDVTISADTGFFQCVTERGVFEGWFNSTTHAYGNGAQITGTAAGSTCLGTWIANPKP